MMVPVCTYDPSALRYIGIVHCYAFRQQQVELEELKNPCQNLLPDPVDTIHIVAQIRTR